MSANYASKRMWCDSVRKIPSIGLLPVEIRGCVGVLSEGYGHGRPGVCLGDSQTETEGVPSQGGRGDALPRNVPTPDLTIDPIVGNVRVKGTKISRDHELPGFCFKIAVVQDWDRIRLNAKIPSVHSRNDLP